MIHAQLIKLKRTPFIWYLTASTTGIIALFLLYNSLYSGKPADDRMKLIFEIYGVALPLLHGLTVFFLTGPDEQMANMYGLLSVKNRTGMFMTLVSLVWGIESLRTALVFLVMGLQTGIQVTGMQILLFAAGEIMISLLSIVFHLWLNLKFGVALSLFFAVLELLQSVMYSNINIVGLWRFLPAAWAMEWKSDVLNQAWVTNLPFWGSCLLIILLAMAVFNMWFYRWEGRRK
jgi:ABC-2 type transport system permease protein